MVGEDGREVSAMTPRLPLKRPVTLDRRLWKTSRGDSSLTPRRTDPLDLTVLTYMDTGDTIPVDVVVLKDAEGNSVTIT